MNFQLFFPLFFIYLFTFYSTEINLFFQFIKILVLIRSAGSITVEKS